LESAKFLAYFFFYFLYPHLFTFLFFIPKKVRNFVPTLKIIL